MRVWVKGDENIHALGTQVSLVEFSREVHDILGDMHLHRSMVKGQRSTASVYTHCMTSSRACPNERGLPPSWSRWR